MDQRITYVPFVGRPKRSDARLLKVAKGNIAYRVAKRFEERQPVVRIDVQTGGSGKEIADARMGVAEIDMASRRLKPDEADLTTHQIAATRGSAGQLK